MGRGKRKGNPLFKGVSKLAGKIGGTAIDGGVEVVTGSGKKTRSSGEATGTATDWSTREPAPDRKRRA